jgi:hypothetical protein
VDGAVKFATARNSERGNGGTTMRSIELTNDEAQLLRSVLEGYLREASGEISNTEKYELRDQLKQDREVIRKIVHSL